MSKNAFNLSKEALEVFKVDEKLKVKPVPVQEKDDYDRIDEMFLALNNALEAKEEELKEREEALNEREKQLAREELDLRDESNELDERRKEVKEAEKNQELLKGTANTIRRTLQMRNKELKDKNKELEDLRNSVSIIFTQIPPSVKNNTLPFMNRIRDFDKPLYQRFLNYYEPIEVALRHIHELSFVKNDQDTCMKISAAIYGTQFPATTAKDIYEGTMLFLMRIESINNEELQKAIAVFKDRVLGDIIKAKEEEKKQKK